MAGRENVMNYSFNVADDREAEMNAFLENYARAEEPMMNFSSKRTRSREFEDMRDMIVLVGGVLSAVIGLIGVLNFINSMLTGIITRRREFAMLQSIGMTGRQLRQMLTIEGLCYAGLATAISLVAGSALSLLIGRGLLGQLWFFSYRFTLLPLAAVAPLLFAIGAVAPRAMLRSVERQSVVERLRE